ncbi:hypothetical protein F7725_009430 [Dissostichus mawsoni]|uniref:Uncharacterized protein n=1 Tax=Dissostichus mawsoni TaxID=36200 RepID=A0A7J5XKQ5_DISMA|nr:hypothetical protein F7725_009430 [Dissostichus mawsoni]
MEALRQTGGRQEGRPYFSAFVDEKKSSAEDDGGLGGKTFPTLMEAAPALQKMNIQIRVDERDKLQRIPLSTLVFMSQQSQKKVGVLNIYVKHTLKVWSAVQKRYRGTVALSRAMQIDGNLEFLPSIADSTFKKWADRGLKIIDQLFYDNILQPFSYLQETFQLPSCDMFRLGITLQHIEIGT